MNITLDKLESVPNKVLIDIREEYERENYAYADSINIPMGNLMNEVSSLDSGNSYVLFCQSGNRSGKMVKMLHANGYKNFLSLEGGANLMKEKGL